MKCFLVTSISTSQVIFTNQNSQRKQHKKRPKYINTVDFLRTMIGIYWEVKSILWLYFTRTMQRILTKPNLSSMIILVSPDMFKLSCLIATSRVVIGALAHSIQHCSACKIPIGRDSKLAEIGITLVTSLHFLEQPYHYGRINPI